MAIETVEKTSKAEDVREQDSSYLKARFVVGLATLLIGLWAANLALFNWVEPSDVNYLLGEYARYVCAYGGFAAMISGAMLINDFLVLRKVMAKKTLVKPLKSLPPYQRILAKTAWLLAEDLKKSSVENAEIDIFTLMLAEEEKVVAQQKTEGN